MKRESLLGDRSTVVEFYNRMHIMYVTSVAAVLVWVVVLEWASVLEGAVESLYVVRDGLYAVACTGVYRAGAHNSSGTLAQQLGTARRWFDVEVKDSAGL